MLPRSSPAESFARAPGWRRSPRGLPLEVRSLQLSRDVKRTVCRSCSLIRIRSLDSPQPFDQPLQLFVAQPRPAFPHVNGDDAPAVWAESRVVDAIEVVTRSTARPGQDRLRLGTREERRDFRRDVRAWKRLRAWPELRDEPVDEHFTV